MSMTIKGVVGPGWPRWSTLGPSVSMEQYRALQSGAEVSLPDDVALKLVSLGVVFEVARSEE